MNAETPAAAPITACLLHADFHAMGQDCWASTVDWYFAHQDIPAAERRDAYQAEVERLMLDVLRTGVAS